MIDLNDLKGFVERKWAIFPTHSIRDGACSCGDASCNSPGKHPRVSNGVKAATTNTRQIESWAEQFPDANWAVATGAPSGVWVLDLDSKPDKDGTESLKAWLAESHAQMFKTHTVETGGGGWHYYWKDVGLGNRANILPGVDVRGDGGYVLLPGSSHISGKTYRVARDGEPKLADERLVELARRSAPKPSPLDGRASILDPIPEGERDDTLFRLACSLRRKLGDDRSAVELLVLEAARASGFSEKDALVKVESAFRQDHTDSMPSLFGADSPRLNLRGASEIRSLPKPVYLIEGVMPEGALFQVFGETGAYKSFVMLDVIASVANGIDWMGHAVTTAGPVAFILAEGGYDAGIRIEAWMQAHPGASDEKIAYSIEEQLDLMNESVVDAIMDDLEAYRLARFPDESWRMIVFDTQADHMPMGDEDKAHDFTVIKQAIQRIALATGAAVGLVHHTGHNKLRERGSSRQRQALDVVMRVHANQITNEKQKGAPKFEPIPFTVEPVADSIVIRGVSPVSAAVAGFEAEVESGRAVLAYLAANPRASQNSIKSDLSIGASTWPELRDLLEGLGYLEVTRDSNGTARSVRVTAVGLASYGIDPDPEA